MAIRKRLDLQGAALSFVTTTVKDWMPAFSLESAAEAGLGQLKETLGYFNVSLAGYVLMPPHLHAMFGFRDIQLLSKFVQSFKSLSSRRIKQMEPGQLTEKFIEPDGFRLWKPRFDDFVIISEKQFRIKLNYIHENPVRAGLVSNAIDYKYSSARDWLTDEKGLIEIDKNISWYI